MIQYSMSVKKGLEISFDLCYSIYEGIVVFYQDTKGVTPWKLRSEESHISTVISA
jgi:hypothetical protein